eukprot:Selendium_serpulae@DN1328_c0_g1_i1.p1
MIGAAVIERTDERYIEEDRNSFPDCKALLNNQSPQTNTGAKNNSQRRPLSELFAEADKQRQLADESELSRTTTATDGGGTTVDQRETFLRATPHRTSDSPLKSTAASVRRPLWSSVRQGQEAPQQSHFENGGRFSRYLPDQEGHSDEFPENSEDEDKDHENLRETTDEDGDDEDEESGDQSTCENDSDVQRIKSKHASRGVPRDKTKQSMEDNQKRHRELAQLILCEQGGRINSSTNINGKCGDEKIKSHHQRRRPMLLFTAPTELAGKLNNERLTGFPVLPPLILSSPSPTPKLTQLDNGSSYFDIKKKQGKSKVLDERECTNGFARQQICLPLQKSNETKRTILLEPSMTGSSYHSMWLDGEYQREKEQLGPRKAKTKDLMIQRT